MEDKIKYIKDWLGSGSINIFGLPMSGKDTVGMRLAKDLNAEFLSSGSIIREFEENHKTDITSNGELTPTDLFYELVLPYFNREELKEKALILSSIGRWSGEEVEVLRSAKEAGHDIKLVIYLNMDKHNLKTRWLNAQENGDRGNRADDKNLEIFEVRLREFEEKTLPVLEKYREMGILETVMADSSREEVYNGVINSIYNKVKTELFVKI